MKRRTKRISVSVLLALTLAFSAAVSAAAEPVQGAAATIVSQDLLQPEGVAVDPKGVLYIADTGNSRICRNINGSAVMFAGKIVSRDAYGRAGGELRDGASGTARFHNPARMAVDAAGKVYVSDTENNCIRLIENGRVSTFCGAQTPGYEDGSRSAARFNAPQGIALDAQGNLYVADSGNHVIRKIDPSGTVSHFAGYPGVPGYSDSLSRTSFFNEPAGLAVGPDGAVYVADSGNQRIRKIKDGRVATLAGGGLEKAPDSPYYEGGFADGSGSEARFFFPQGICMGEDGTLYVADTLNHAVRKITADGAVTTVAGGETAGYQDGPLSKALFNAPSDLCYFNGKLYLADTQNNLIRVLEPGLKGEDIK